MAGSRCQEDSYSYVQQFSGWLSKNRDENPRMRKIFNSKSPPKVRACADSRRNFWTTNLKTAVLPSEERGAQVWNQS